MQSKHNLSDVTEVEILRIELIIKSIAKSLHKNENSIDPPKSSVANVNSRNISVT